MNVNIKYIERTPLEKQALTKLIKHFFHTNKNINIVFDKRISSLGLYAYYPEGRQHKIFISPVLNWVSEDLYIHSESYARRKFISCILHEIRHAQQREKYGSRYFNSVKFNFDLTKKKYIAQVWHSSCEKDARQYERKNIDKAMKMYRSFLKKGKK